MTLGRAIGCGRDEGLVGVARKVIWIRKRYLDPHERKRAPRKAEAA